MLARVAIRPTNNTLGQGFFPGPRYASRLGKSPALPIANATRETPKRSERASLKVVSNTPADAITGPIPLPRANRVAASGEEDCDSLVAPSTEIAAFRSQTRPDSALSEEQWQDRQRFLQNFC